MSVRRGENNAVYIPAGQIMEGETARYVLATVHGTALVLADGGFSDDEIVEWLLTPHEQLDGTPLDALRAGQRAHVRRLAQTAL